MKKYLLLCTALTISSSAYALDCATPPTCDELGYTMSSDDCAGQFMLKCPFDDTKLFCGGNKPAIECEIGSILYDDLKCYEGDPSIHTGKTPIAVVFDATNKRAIGLTNANLPWYSNSTTDLQAVSVATADAALSASLTGNTSGNGSYCTTIYSTKNTGITLLTTYAPYYCYTLTYKGHSDWFLPSLRELSDIYDNKELVSSSRVKAGGTAIANGGYWSSTERTGTDSGGGYTAFTFYMGSNGTASYSAYQFNNYVSCAISY